MPRNYNRTKRKRGGQPGNKNAVKTGFYTRCFRPADIADLETHKFTGLEDEITLIRVFIRRLLEDMDKTDSIKERLAILRALSMASVGITRLLKVDDDVYGNSHTLMDEIMRISGELTAEDEEKFRQRKQASEASPEDGAVYHVDYEEEEDEEGE